jgi:hypothetical protein
MLPFIIYFFAGAALLGFFASLLMAVTIVGVCRFGECYRRFFERLKKLGTLDSVKEMSNVYFAILNKFIGKDVGIKQPGVVEKAKYFGLYIEHLLLIYWIGATVLVLAFRPVEPTAETVDSLQQAGAFAILLTINILSDAASLLWTKRCIAILAGKVPNTSLTARRLFVVLAQDISFAAILMVAVQVISNGLYAFQIGRPHEFFKDMTDVWTALKPYHPYNSKFSWFQFPGQLVITCTTYLPSLLFYVTCLVVWCLMPFYRILILALSICDPKAAIYEHGQPQESCNQVSFAGLVLGAIGSAATCGALFIGTLPFMHQN